MIELEVKSSSLIIGTISTISMEKEIMSMNLSMFWDDFRKYTFLHYSANITVMVKLRANFSELSGESYILLLTLSDELS